MLFIQKYLLVFIAALSTLAIMSCGIKEEAIKEAESRITLLDSKGVPDSLLSEAKVQVFQATTKKQLGESAGAKRALDSAITLLNAAETAFAATMQNYKPIVDSMRSNFEQRKKGLTGLQLRAADSLLMVITALSAKNDWAGAHDKGVEVDSAMNQLQKDEQVAAQTRPKLLGTWLGADTYKGKGASFVEKKSFSFSSDGKVQIVETKKGQSSEYLKEDWEFRSSGRYDLKGDTIFVFIEREQSPRQIYWDLKGKEWVKNERAPYDSTISAGKKDRFMTYAFMKENLKKNR
jgi:hypothetical protein